MKQSAKPQARMPVLFVGHGNPMNALEDNSFSRAWETAATSLPKPRAILCISAHWESDGTWVSTTAKPDMIYDFYGFPDELYKVVYPVPGAPDWAKRTQAAVTTTKVSAEPKRGLDHGTWVVLKRMFPKADIPVFQMSLDRRQSPAAHYAIGQQLQSLREQGLLIVGSGNIVHNLRLMMWSGSAYPWATEFDQRVAALIMKRDHKALIEYPALGKDAELAIPTNEHYLPLLYTLALQRPEEQVTFFADEMTLGSISMRSLKIG